MTDREFLMWLHERLVNVHGEDECFDYMHKLRAIINAIPADKKTPNMGSGNSLDELRKMLDSAQSGEE